MYIPELIIFTSQGKHAIKRNQINNNSVTGAWPSLCHKIAFGHEGVYRVINKNAPTRQHSVPV